MSMWTGYLILSLSVAAIGVVACFRRSPPAVCRVTAIDGRAIVETVGECRFSSSDCRLLATMIADAEGGMRFISEWTPGGGCDAS